MTSATSTGWQARLKLGFTKEGSRTVLRERVHDGPLRLQKPLYPEGDAVCHAVIVHPPGGIAGGDQLQIHVQVGQAAQGFITTPGATKWYGGKPETSSQQVHIQLEEQASLEWLPQENIVFNHAQAQSATRIDLAHSSRLLAWDMTVLGRKAMQESFSHGVFSPSLSLYVQNRLLWAEQSHIQGNDPLLSSPLGLRGRHVFGTLCAYGMTDWSDELLEALRSIQPAKGDSAGLTLMPQGLLLARIVSSDPEAARHYLCSLWQILRPIMMHIPHQQPRIWAT